MILDHIGQRTDNKQLPFIRFRQNRHHRREGCIFALGKGRFDSRAGIIQDAHIWKVHLCQTLGGAREIEFDDLGRARSDKEKLLDVRPA